MKNIITSYSFDASARTIDFSGYAGFTPERLVAIFNATDNILIYGQGIAGKGYTNFAAGVLTLQHDTTSMDDADDLQVVYLPGDYATQTTLAAILAKIIAAPATEAKQNTANDHLANIAQNTDGIEGVLANILAKIISAPATEAKQDSIITHIDGVESALASIFAKIISAPATEAKQDTLITHVDGVETALSNILAKIIAAPATEAKQDSIINRLPATLGQSNMAGSFSAVLASDQPALPMPVTTASGNITTQNLVPAGAATANSAVEIVLNGASNLIVQTTGTYTGALSLQVTLNGTTWVTVGGLPFINVNTGGYLSSITSALQSVFRANVAGALRARITGLAAMTGTATVTLRATPDSNMMALDAALPAGSNAIGNVGQSGTWTVQPGNTVNTTPWLVTPRPSNVGTGGLSISRVISAANNNTTVAKNAAGSLHAIIATNVNAAVRYLKLYNRTTVPTVETDVPVMTIPIPGNTAGAGIVIPFPHGVNFSTGIAYALTTGVADTDTGAVAANEIVVQVLFA